MKREPKREPPPPRLLAPFFARFLTLASRSLLRNSTETLATQVSLAQASSQPLSHAYFCYVSYLGKQSRLIIVWSYDWMSFSVFAIRITSILKKSTVSAQGYDMSSLEDILLDCKTVGFFLKISKEIGKAWRKSLTRAKRASLTRVCGACEAREKASLPSLALCFQFRSRPFVWLPARTWIRKNTDCFAV